MAKITVYINRSLRRERWLDAHKRGDPLDKVLAFTATGEHRQLLEDIFVELNRPQPEGIGSLTRQQIMQYHSKFPSLSVSDVVEIDGTWYSVARIGFDSIEAPRLEEK